MACQFSEGWSGTPMWQLAQGREETMRKEREAREAQAGDVLEIDNEAAGFRSVLYVSKMVGDKYEDSKVRGPRRKTRAQAIKDGLSLRNACRDAPKDAKLEATQRRSVELMFTFWKPEELPKEDFDFEESIEKPMRLRLARKPRGNGWQRVGDKEFFKHCSAPMAFDPVKGRYFKIDADTNSYIDCDVPHDPIEYPVSVSVGASLVGRTDEDLNAPDRPRSMLLKELVKTGAAMKTPLFFLDQPAACYAMFDGVRGGAAVEWCSKHFHTKLLPQLSASITYWHDADLRGLLRSIFAELDVQLVQQAGCCWEGVSMTVALLLGDRLVVSSLGGTHALVASPDGRWRSLDGRHVPSSVEEQIRTKALGAEVVGEEKGKGVVGAPFVQKTLRPRDWQVVEDAAVEDEVARVLDRTSDCFATLGLGSEDKIDGKTARSCYKRLALKVHPDKAPEELKARAKAAFEKVEKAAAVVEAFCETDMEATECLHRILHAAGAGRAAMSRAMALEVLQISEDCSLEEAGKKGRELRETIMKLGMLTDGNYGHPDQAEAVRMIEEAAEAIAEPSTLTASKGGASFTSLKPVQVTRALGLRDLKLPRKIVSSEPQIDVIQLEALGSHHLVLLSSGATSLSDQEVIERVRGFSGQPKAASLLVAADAAARNAAQGIAGPQRFGCCIVGVFEVGSGYVEPPAKKAKKDGGDKVGDFRQNTLPAGDWLDAQVHCSYENSAAATHWEGLLQSDIPQEWSATRDFALQAMRAKAEDRRSDGMERMEELAAIAAGVAGAGQVADGVPDTCLARMAVQLGYYWWHTSNADTSKAECCLSLAVQSFHASHWRLPAWRGVNLGGWLLLEPGPASPFFDVCYAKIVEVSSKRVEDAALSGTRENPPGLGDEYSVCAALQAAGGDELRLQYVELTRARNGSHKLDKTFLDIAKTGLNAVRIPFGHWVVSGPGHGEPYDGPCLEVLDSAIQLAEAQGLQVLLDLHGNPGGESGSRPSGRESSLWRWQDWRHDEAATPSQSTAGCHVLGRKAVEMLRLIAVRYCDKSCVTGIQVCNEPSEAIPADRLCDFYEKAIEAIRSGGMGPDKVAVVLPIFTHWRVKEVISCWHSRGNCFRFDNVAFDIHYYHDFSAIWRLLPHNRHVEVVAEHARELKLLPGSLVGEWSLSRPGDFSDEEKADFAHKQVQAYNHSSHGWFFWNWHDHDFYPDWDFERGVLGSKLPHVLGRTELEALPVGNLYRASALGHSASDVVAASDGMGEHTQGSFRSDHPPSGPGLEVARVVLVVVLPWLILSCGLSVSDCIEKTDLQERQASKAPTVVLQNLIRHFGLSSSGLADKAELVQYALQALRMTKALPLLIVLHGAGRSKESVDGFVLPFSRISSRQNALVAIPMSLDNTWDLRAAVATGQASADTAFISHIIDCLMRDYRVDAGRIALMGFSDGGSYALSLAVSNPGVFQAAMSWSAGYYQNAPVASAASSSLPHIFHAHGRADELFNFEKVALPMRRSLRSSGHNVTSHNVLSAGHSAPSDFASLAAERELMRLKESLTKDASQFPALARKHSECKSALQPGQMAGDLGWISKGSLGDAALEDVVLALEVNELSDLVTTARGVHLVQRYA
ncbi:exgA [Symbiodinium pilosum]|uniref:glucan 1,3-beta-glucosidase n=1 Tax=Symbiodinium pilosum TaxID=2952 RepID=A0A812VMT6_SYMPI|nr:exgA [Symbiodinium pilosum]